MTSAVVAMVSLVPRYSFAEEGRKNMEKPNILIIVTDDQGYGDLSAFEHHAPHVT